MSARRGVCSLFLAAAVMAGAGPARASDPGPPYSATAPLSDQKVGSVLFFPYYTSGEGKDPVQDTRIAITNHSDTSAAFLRLFFVNGASGRSAASTLCLTAQQTAAFDMSEIRPGETGFLVAIAISGVNGCPVSSFLTPFVRVGGQADVRRADGFGGALAAVAVQGLFDGQLPGCDDNSVTVVLNFNGVLFSGYNQLPRTLALTSLSSSADGQTLLVVNRIGGNLLVDAADIGTLTGTLFDQSGGAFTYPVTAAAPQLVSALTGSFPGTTPSFAAVVPAGQTGWTRLRNDAADVAYIGAAFFLDGPLPIAPGVGDALAARFPAASPAGAVNLRTLEPAATVPLTIPVFPPSC